MRVEPVEGALRQLHIFSRGVDDLGGTPAPLALEANSRRFFFWAGVRLAPLFLIRTPVMAARPAARPNATK